MFSNVERLRDFIKHVYVDRRYSGERSIEKPPRGKMVHILSRSSSILTFRIAHDVSYRRRISMMSSLEHIFCSKTFDVQWLNTFLLIHIIFDICRLKPRT